MEIRNLTADELADRMGARRCGDQWSARCPAHDDRSPSLSIGKGVDGQVLLNCHAGCAFEDVVAALEDHLDGERAAPVDLSPASRSTRVVGATTTYQYKSADGMLLFEVVRREPKAFFQRRPDGSGGWVNNVNGVAKVLYRLPELLDAPPWDEVFVVEGEKDADRLAGLGLVATTSPGGAGKWQEEFNQVLNDRNIVILPDNDEPGRLHARRVAKSLQAVARSVRIVELPGLRPKGDVSDYLDAGGNRATLLELTRRTNIQTPDFVNHVNEFGDATDKAWPLLLPIDRVETPEWPVGILPSNLDDYVLALANELGISPTLVGPFVLGALAVACQRKVEAAVAPGWAEPASLFLVAIAPSGSRKSAVVKRVFQPIREWERDRQRALTDTIAVAEADHRVLDQRVQRAQAAVLKAAAGSDDERAAQADLADAVRALAHHRVPSAPRLIVDDVTPEKLIRMMAAHGGRMAVVSAEGTTFAHARGMYADGGTANLSPWLNGHAGDDIRFDRVSGSELVIPSAALSLCVGMQPGDAALIAGDARLVDRGMFARTLWTITGESPEYGGDPVSERLRTEFESTMRRLLDLPAEIATDGMIIPRPITFAPKATEVVREFERRLRARTRDDGDLAGLASWAAKAHGHAARVALLICISEPSSFGSEVVGADHAVRAVRLLEEFFIPHVVATASRATADPDVSLARRFLGWIERYGGDGFSERDLYANFARRHVGEPAAMRRPLALLAERGYIRPIDAGASIRGRGGRPTPRWEVHPDLRHATSAGCASSG